MFWLFLTFVFFFSHFVFFSKVNYYKYAYVITKAESTGLIGYFNNWLFGFINSNNRFLTNCLKDGYNIPDIAFIDSICYSVLEGNFRLVQADKKNMSYVVSVNEKNNVILARKRGEHIEVNSNDTILPPSTINLINRCIDKIDNMRNNQNRDASKTIF